jgi:hypothetical protein
MRQLIPLTDATRFATALDHTVQFDAWAEFDCSPVFCFVWYRSLEGETVMSKTQLVPSAMLFAAVLIFAPFVDARAETVVLKADLKGSNEVPPNSSPASGTAEATFDTSSKVLSWTVTYKDLTGPALGAHFHGPGEAGKNAGIVLPFKTVQSPIQGSATLTDAQAADLLAGKWYANIHTAANPGGELHGQMMK